MSLFGYKEQQKNQQKEAIVRQKEENDRRVRCQEEINLILRKYNLTIRARFELVEQPKQPEQTKET